MSWWTPLFGNCCQGEKPGGLALTDYAVDYCGFDSGSCLLDVAGGNGATVRHLQERLRCYVTGIDSDPACQSSDIAIAQAERLPWSDHTFDGILLECALSQMESPELPLLECARVLRPGGWLILSDLYDRGGNGADDTPLGRLDNQETLASRLLNVNLKPILFEDHSHALASLWAGALLSGSGEGLLSTLRQSLQLQNVKIGYCLYIAKKL